METVPASILNPLLGTLCSEPQAGIGVTLVSPAPGCQLPSGITQVLCLAGPWLLWLQPPNQPHLLHPTPPTEHEPWCCLNAALLDLPIQPATEVLGFGLGPASSTQHLPFRFYDQCRRGSSDPTVQRSVFASVDKVPGEPPPPCTTSCPLLGVLGLPLGCVCVSFPSPQISRLLEASVS